MINFHLRIAKPEKKLFEGDVPYCQFTTPEGSMGVKARHEPFLATLKDGSEFVYWLEGGEEKTLTVYNAMISFKDNACVLTVT